jgi:hypothetical protein
MKIVGSVAISIMLIAVTPSPATIINIPDDYPTIQQGINASSDGDTVLVQPGSYVENINFIGRNIVVGSLFLTTQDDSYISSTVIDGNQSGSVVTFQSGESNAAIITGFTIKNGISFYGGGIYCVNGSNPTIASNKIIENKAGYEEIGVGAGIYCSDSSPIILQNTISGNTIDTWQGSGGGIMCYNSSAFISDNIITNNSVLGYGGSFGGGLYCEDNCIIQNNTIIGNFADDSGGGIDCWGNNIISYNIIAANVSRGGGGGIFYGGSCLINNNTIIENQSYDGGGIWGHSDHLSSPLIKNSIIRDNSPSEIYFSILPALVIYNDIEGGWEGEGNIDCDPMFCAPEYDNYHLHTSSCCIGAGENGVDIGAFGAGCGLVPCGDYVVGDFNGSGVFNVADVVAGYSRLKTGLPNPYFQCECPPLFGQFWVVAADVNNSCAFNVADIVDGYSNLKTGSPELIPCEHCPPEG